MQFEDDDLFQTMRAAFGTADYGGAGPDDMANDVLPDEALAAEEEALTHDSVIEPDLDDLHDKVPSVGAAEGSHSGGSHRSRRRGSRGGVQSSRHSHTSHQSAKPERAQEKRWRSGQIPSAPTFDGDIDSDPYCLRHYKRRLWRWVRITREFLPANEQALRAREQLRGEAELEFEEVGDERFDHEEGIQRLLDDLEVSFGERALFRQGGIIREFESIGRLQGETIHAFVRRFRLTERKLQDNQVPPYPEEARVVKLLDGLRLDERSTSTILLAAGNEYKMQRVLDAIRIQYPAGMTVTGVPTSHALNNKKQKGKPRWNAWLTHESAGYDDAWDYMSLTITTSLTRTPLMTLRTPLTMTRRRSLTMWTTSMMRRNPLWRLRLLQLRPLLRILLLPIGIRGKKP